jgi:hypothetical protein
MAMLLVGRGIAGVGAAGLLSVSSSSTRVVTEVDRGLNTGLRSSASSYQTRLHSMITTSKEQLWSPCTPLDTRLGPSSVVPF